MPRKPDLNKKNRYFDPFPERLRKLMEEHGTSQEEIKSVLELKNRQSVTGYVDGSTVPTAEKIIAIAEYYNVSADYLLGLTDSPTVDKDMKTAIKVTGLSQKAIENILYWSVDDIFADTLDEFLSFEDISDFIYAISDVLIYATGIPYKQESRKESFSSGFLDEYSELSQYLKDLKFSVFEVSESASLLVAKMSGADELKEKLSSRLDELFREKFEKNKPTVKGEETDVQH